jgi:pimeloyl-ACP methyl ester carboxylesterase
MRMQNVPVGDLQIACATSGEGPPLVLLHGGWCDSRAWRWQLDGLGGDFAVAAWHAPGCGRSANPPADWRMPDYADCLAAWLEAAGIERPHVLGLSWGSTLALELYRRHPQVPASLVLVGAYAGWAGSLPAEVVAERLQRALGELERPPEDSLPRRRRPISPTRS